MRVAASIVLVALLAGCATGSPPLPTPTGEGIEAGPVQPVGTPEVVADNLEVPWSILPLESGSILISERDTGLIKEITLDGETHEVGAVPGVAASGEGGLLGLALGPGAGALYAYLTTASDNRIVKMPLEGSPGSLSIGAPTTVLEGLAKADHHNGGRIAFGPDDLLYATVGDAGQPDAAQDVDSLNGKILRMTPDGTVPDDNPFGGSLVYSYGHRNPQGITWDNEGQLWASEFGQDTWDELNRIEPGKNYGWPIVEGISDDDEFVNPVAQWRTDEASPSGLLFLRHTFFMAALGGERLWVIYPTSDSVDPVAYFEGEYGRIRDVAAAADGSLYFLTNNTDGRGTPVENDDKLYRVRLDVLREG